MPLEILTTFPKLRRMDAHMGVLVAALTTLPPGLVEFSENRQMAKPVRAAKDSASAGTARAELFYFQ